MGHAFGPARRIRKRPEFQRVYEQGRKWHGRYLMLFVLANGRDTSRLGIAATRKIGGAVQRNLAKRRIREMFRTTDVPAGFDVVVVPKREFFEADWSALCGDFSTALGRQFRAGVGRPHGRHD